MGTGLVVIGSICAKGVLPAFDLDEPNFEEDRLYAFAELKRRLLHLRMTKHALRTKST